MDQFIDGVIATADHIGAKKRSTKKINLSFDEWNLWNESRFVGQQNLEWAKAPRLIEDEYTVQDAVVVGNLLMSLLRHSDRVTVACLAQLVNVIAPIRSEPGSSAWKQTIFYPFALTARYARGDVLRTECRTATLPSPTRGDVPAVDVIATRDPEHGSIAIFAVNRHETEPATLRVALPAPSTLTVAVHIELGGESLLNTNSQAMPERVVPRPSAAHRLDNQGLTAQLPPVSWTLLRVIPNPTH